MREMREMTSSAISSDRISTWICVGVFPSSVLALVTKRRSRPSFVYPLLYSLSMRTSS